MVRTHWARRPLRAGTGSVSSGGKRRETAGEAVAERFDKGRIHRPQRGRGQTARGQQRAAARGGAAVLRCGGKFAGEGTHAKAGHFLSPSLGKGKAQSVQHGGGHVAGRIGAALRVHARRYAEGRKELQHLCRREGGEGGRGKGGVAKVVLRGGVYVGEIAAAIAGGEQLAPHARLRFEYGGTPARARKRHARRQTGRAAADDDGVVPHSTIPSFFEHLSVGQQRGRVQGARAGGCRGGGARRRSVPRPAMRRSPRRTPDPSSGDSSRPRYRRFHTASRPRRHRSGRRWAAFRRAFPRPSACG